MSMANGTLRRERCPPQGKATITCGYAALSRLMSLTAVACPAVVCLLIMHTCSRCAVPHLEHAGAGVELDHSLPVHGAWVDGESVSQVQPRKGHQRCSKRLGPQEPVSLQMQVYTGGAWHKRLREARGVTRNPSSAIVSDRFTNIDATPNRLFLRARRGNDWTSAPSDTRSWRAGSNNNHLMDS